MARGTAYFVAVSLLTVLSHVAVQAAVFPGRGITASTGNQRGLYLAIRPDTATPLSQAKIDAIRASERVTREFYAEASGGKLNLRYTDVVDVPIALTLNPQDNQLH